MIYFQRRLPPQEAGASLHGFAAQGTSLKITLTAPDAITPYENNPRQNDSAVDAIARSIEEFGFRQPVVVDEHNVIIVGHTRWKAAKQLGLESIPVHVAEGLAPEKAKAYRIADNATNAIATWDAELLPVELDQLKDLGIDLDSLGFSEDELAAFMSDGANPGQCDPDEVPEPPAEPVTSLGDLWVLGEHRLLCGDSSSKAERIPATENAPADAGAEEGDG